MNHKTITLTEVYQTLYGPKIRISNIEQLATDLSAIAGRQPAWSWKHVHSLVKGYPGFRVTRTMERAALALLRIHQGVEETVARLLPTQVLSPHDLPPNTWVLAKPRRCARPGCNVYFIPIHTSQEYHSPACEHAVPFPQEEN